MTRGLERAVVVAGALGGLAGVALSAAAAHVTGPGSLDVAARFLLAHAPVFLGLAAALRTEIVSRRLGALAAGAIGLGLLLFCGDLSVRALAGVAPVPMGAPTGGVILMAGWLLLAASAIARSR